MESDQLENPLYYEILDGENVQPPTLLDSSTEPKESRDYGNSAIYSR